MTHRTSAVLRGLLSIFLSLCAFARGEQSTAAALPEPVQAALRSNYPGAQVLKSSQKESAVELKLTDDQNKGQEYKVRLGLDGKVIEEERHWIPDARVPDAARQACLQWLAQAPRVVAWTVEREEGEEPVYRAQSIAPGGKGHVKAYFTAAGRLIKGDQVAPAPEDASTDHAKGTHLPAPGPKETDPKIASPPGPAAEEEVDPDVLRKVTKLIRGTLKDDLEEREKAWGELREMGNLAVPGLLALAKAPTTTPQMMESLVNALADAKDPRAGPALVEMLNRPEPLLRGAVARALGDAGFKPAAGPLAKLCAKEGEDEEVRRFAAGAAARLGAPEGLAALKVLLKSPQAETRARAAYDLGRYGGAAEVPALAEALQDAQAGVRGEAVDALRRIGRKEAWGPLVTASKDADYKVRNAAMQALRELTKQKIENDSQAWQEWWAHQKDGDGEVK